jgi:ABC-2 type transport system ATP-binding protein
VSGPDAEGAGNDGTPAVAVRALVHSFGAAVAVADVDLTVPAGAVFGLLGPNGAGKTTTLRVITTLLPVQQGRVSVFGLDVARSATSVRRRLGYVPQQLSVEGALSGRQNVAWFARLYDVPRRERAGRVDDALAAMDLLDAADRLASGYSGGMIRRLELAQALVARPELLVLDEPTVGLDPIARDGVWERVRRMRAEHGMTVLLTTHYMEEAEHLADRVGIVVGGRLVVVGTPAEIVAGAGVTSVVSFRLPEGVAVAEVPDLGGPLVPEGLEWHLRTSTPTPALQRLTTWAEQRGTDLPALTVTRPSLEDVYLDLVSGAGTGSQRAVVETLVENGAPS